MSLGKKNELGIYFNKVVIVPIQNYVQNNTEFWDQISTNTNYAPNKT